MKFHKQLIIPVSFCFILMLIVSCQHKRSKAANQTRYNIAEKLKEYRQNFRDSLPKPSGYINDYENIYSDREESVLDSLLAAFEKSDSVQIAVISFDSSMIEKDSLDAMTLRIANGWGVGQKYKNNGITVGICIGHRKLRVLNGFGLEKILTNNETKEIVDFVFIPAFSNGQYFKGTLQGLNALIARLRKNRVQNN